MLQQHLGHPHTQHTAPRFMYVRKAVGAQRLIMMKHVEWIEYDPIKNALRMKMAYTPEPDEYIPNPQVEDPSTAKRVFYDLLKDARSDGRVIEW